MEHALAFLSRRYPQLLFPITPGISKTAEFRNAIYFGKPYSGQLDFTMSEKDRFLCMDTPAGTAEVLLLYNRTDFEKCFCALANRCEPKLIPPSVGACMISGLLNQEKIRRYGNHEEKTGLLSFLKPTFDQACYDKLILLSSGWYSGITPEEAGFSDAEWTPKSITIRMYHEITHFVCRTLYPKDISVIRDEVFADMIGIVAAFGYYDTHMANLFLGIDGANIRENGRIHYYVKEQDADSVLEETKMWISLLEQKATNCTDNINDLIVKLFEALRLVR